MGKKTPKHHEAQSYCVLCKKTGMPERKYILHSSKNCFGKRYDQHSKYWKEPKLIELMLPRIIRYLNTNGKKELKSLKKLNKLLYRISKKFSLLRELKNIKKIKEKASKKRGYSSSSISSIDSDSSFSSERK